MILNKIMQFKIYRKIIISYALLITLTVFTVSGILYALFSASAAREIAATSSAMLEQTGYAADVVYNQVFNIANQLKTDPTIITFLNAKVEDKVVNYNASRLLTNILNVYPFIKYIEICNPANGTYYNTLILAQDEMENLQQKTEELVKANRGKFMFFLPQQLNTQFPDMPPVIYSTLSFVFFQDYLANSDSVIIINVDEKYIQNTIRSLSGKSTEFDTFVMDRSGTVLSHTNSSYFMKDFKDKDYVKKIFADRDGTGCIIENIDHEKQLIAYVKSDYMEWYFVSLKPYAHLLSNINQMRKIILYIALFLVFAGLLISVAITGNIYNPIKKLVDKVKPVGAGGNTRFLKYDEYSVLTEAFARSEEAVTYMKTSAYQSSKMIREKFILDLVKDKFNSMTIPTKILNEIECELKGPFFCTIIFKIDRYAEFKENNTAEDQALCRFIICNVAQDLLSRSCINDAVITEPDEVVVLAQLPCASLPGEIYLIFSEIQEALSNYFHFTVSIGIGDIVDTFEHVATSYATSQENIRYRLFYGHESILDSNKIRSHITNSCIYPYSIEKSLIDSLQSMNKGHVRTHLEEFIGFISTASYYQAIHYSYQLINAIFKNFESTLDMHDEDFRNYLNALNRISSSETITEISGWISRLCMKISELLEEKNNNLLNQKYKNIVEDIKKFIIEHYNDPGLSLEQASDVVELSPGYLGKLFKGVAGISFSDYLNNVRLEKAKEMLATTNEPASRICEKVGIFNISYFSTLFKKNYGVTPSQYRMNSTLR